MHPRSAELGADDARRAAWMRAALIALVLLLVPALGLVLLPGSSRQGAPIAARHEPEPRRSEPATVPTIVPSAPRNEPTRSAADVRALPAPIADASPGAIDGVVVDEHGLPITSYLIAVETFKAPGQEPNLSGGVHASITDPKGAFALTGLAPGHYTLTASAEGRPPTRSDGIDVEAGRATHGARIKLVRGIALSGIVTDRETKAPLAGALVALDGMTNTGANAILSTVAGPDGAYVLDGVPAGTFSVRFGHAGYRDRIVSFDATGRGAVSGNTDLATIGENGASLELSNAGAMLMQDQDHVIVGGLVPNGPSAKAGVLVGDRLVAIDGEKVDGLTRDDCVQRLRGPEGSSVRLTLSRDERALDFTVTRALVSR